MIAVTRTEGARPISINDFELISLGLDLVEAEAVRERALATLRGERFLANSLTTEIEAVRDANANVHRIIIAKIASRNAKKEAAGDRAEMRQAQEEGDRQAAQGDPNAG